MSEKDQLVKKSTNLCIALFALLSVTFAIIQPTWEGFDEPAHYAYIQHIAEKFELPWYDNTASLEVFDSLKKLPLSNNLRGADNLYVTATSNYQQYWARKEDFEREEINGARAIESGILHIWQAQHPPLAYILSTIPYYLSSWGSFYVQFFSLRLFAVLIAILGVLVWKKAFDLLTDDKYLRLMLISYLALNSMLYVHLIRVSNEPFVFLFYSLIFYYIIKIFKAEQGEFKDYILLGALYGLGMLTKGFFLATLPALIIFLLWKLKLSKERTRCLKFISLAFAAFFLCGAWYYIYRQIKYGDFTGITSGAINSLTLDKVLTMDWRSQYREIFMNFRGLFGWSFIRVNPRYYGAYKLFVLLGVLGLIKFYVLDTFTKIKSKESLLKRVVFISLIFVLGLAASMGYANLRFYYPNVTLTGGWYLLGLAGAISIALLTGIDALLIKPFSKKYFLLFFFVLNIYWFYILFIDYLIPTYYVI